MWPRCDRRHQGHLKNLSFKIKGVHLSCGCNSIKSGHHLNHWATKSIHWLLRCFAHDHLVDSVSLPSGNQKQVTWQLALLLTHVWLCEFPKNYQKLVFTFCAIKRINGVSRVVCWIESAQSLTFWSDLFKPQKAVKASLSMLLHSQDEAGLTVPGI